MRRGAAFVAAFVMTAPGYAWQNVPPPQEAPGWSEITRTAKPWTRWWWPGSAVDERNLSAQIDAFARAGLGGIEITPIYGARGAEARERAYLSREWMDALAMTSRAAKRRDLGVDMATGTGWPFGGATVSVADGSSALALVDGKLTGKPTQMKVKRAGPGGEGLVLDPYSVGALGRYLAGFDRAFAGSPRGALRAQFHDSFEYYDAAWTPGLAAAFRELNGYDLDAYARELVGEKPLDADTLSRIKGDYRRTLAKLHLDYVNAWAAWSRARGEIVRNQAHGAPGNLLDLYAAADIPETESYGMTPLPIPGLRAVTDDVNPDPDPALNLVGRFASSAAHVAGRPLASSETLTWLRENFREAPWAAKPQIDRLFVAGINHLFWHGAVYSPDDVPWPGWFFYAASQINPRNPLWNDFAAMNGYVARVQSVLQAGEPANDVLLYWPFDDLVDDPQGLMRQLGVHDNAWLSKSAFGELARALLEAGYTVDYVSDAQLAGFETRGQTLFKGKQRYLALVVPKMRRMPAATAAKLAALARDGANLVLAALPEDVPGYGNLEARRAEFRAALSEPRLRDAVDADVPAALTRRAVLAEPAAQAGLAFVRRRRDDGMDYFFVNLGAQRFDHWLGLATPAKQARLLDPLTARTGDAAVRARGTFSDVYLQLEPGQSVILRTVTRAPIRTKAAPWSYVGPASPGTALTGPWRVAFTAGGPALPAGARLDSLASWTTLGPDAESFAGTARYSIVFDAPGSAAEWLLDLGDVRESARVRLNGREIAAAWSLPFQVRLGALRARGNRLEIDVTNLPANRIRDLDRRRVDWKVMKDINLASLKYKALDASTWSIAPSGLLGPVRLVPLETLNPR